MSGQLIVPQKVKCLPRMPRNPCRPPKESPSLFGLVTCRECMTGTPTRRTEVCPFLKDLESGYPPTIWCLEPPTEDTGHRRTCFTTRWHSRKGCRSLVYNITSNMRGSSQPRDKWSKTSLGSLTVTHGRRTHSVSGRCENRASSPNPR